MNKSRCLEDAFRLLQEKSAPAVAVVDAAGRLVGLVTSETIGEMLMLHQALPSGVRFGPWGPSPDGAPIRRRAERAAKFPTKFSPFRRLASDLHAAHTASRYNARV